MIPVLGCPILNRPDLLDRMLLSVNVEVDRVVIVDNGACTDLSDMYEVVIPPTNLGVAASWNFIIRSTPDAPWWLLVNADVEFGPRDLERVTFVMDEAVGPMVACLLEFGAFALNRAVINMVGWFDENYHPIYCEDSDYRWRCQLADVPVVPIPSKTRHLEGGSVTYRSDPALAACNASTYPQNVGYHAAKWGGPPGSECYRTPFDQGGNIREWRLHIDRLRDLAWA